MNVSRILFAIVFIGLVVTPLVYRTGGDAPVADGARLVIITPHNEQIRYEIERAFSQWHQQEYGRPVAIDWRVAGTNDMVRILKSQYEALGTLEQASRGVGYDLAFGGGDYVFDRKLKPGVSVKSEDGKEVTIPILQAVELDDAFIKQVYPEPRLAGQKLYDPEGHWYGVVLTSFGIVFNRDALAMQTLSEPTKWSDLTDPRYDSWLALTDPGHSGSICKTYNTIIQYYGFEKGWSVLRRCCANSRYFASSSSQIPLDVASGEAAAGMSIDFYGRYQAQMIPAGRIGYVAPAGETIVNADPVAVLHGAPHPDLARRFVKYLLSEEPQLLWNAKKGDPLGPERYELRRAPIRSDIYDKYADRMTDKEDPFEFAQPIPEGTPDYFSVIPMVMRAMAMDCHDKLRRAWQVINAEQDDERRAKMLAEFDELPFNEQELLGALKEWKASGSRKTEDRLAWGRFFRGQYDRIVEMAKH